ncbi:hypothetical protein M8C21_000692, partial [Ambrosia artemisiifolia]
MYVSLPLCVDNGYSRGSNPMCRREPHIQLSQEEQNAAEESFSVYCKPVELYNILQRRAGDAARHVIGRASPDHIPKWGTAGAPKVKG